MAGSRRRDQELSRAHFSPPSRPGPARHPRRHSPGRRRTPGGAGGESKATLSGSSLSGTTLSIFPGTEASGTAGGVNAGGGGGNGTGNSAEGFSGGGGGASTVAISSFSFANLLVVAGGGGGGGEISATQGGAGGTSASPDGGAGAAASGSAGTNGDGGTLSSGGAAGGTYGTCTGETAGTALDGGVGSTADYTAPTCYGGAGGGGGYYGGGGASSFVAGGGGGSAFPAATTTVGGIEVTPISDAKTDTGNGAVTISYSTASTELTHVSAVKQPGNSLQATATLTASGAPVVGRSVTFTAGPYLLCTAITNSNGVATCLDVYARQVLNSLQKIVTATFDGDMIYSPSTGSGMIIRYI
jgi:hypothetical protein